MPFQGPSGVWEGRSNPNHAGGALDYQEAGRAASGRDEPELVDGASRGGALALQLLALSSSSCVWKAW